VKINDSAKVMYEGAMAYWRFLYRSGIAFDEGESFVSWARKPLSERWKKVVLEGQLINTYAKGNKLSVTKLSDDDFRKFVVNQLHAVHEGYSPHLIKLMRGIVQSIDKIEQSAFVVIANSIDDLPIDVRRQVVNSTKKVLRNAYCSYDFDVMNGEEFDDSFELYPSMHHEGLFNPKMGREELEFLKEGIGEIEAEAIAQSPHFQNGIGAIPFYGRESVVKYDFFVDWSLSKAELLRNFESWIDARMPEKYSAGGESSSSAQREQKTVVRRKSRGGVLRYISDFLFWYVECYGDSASVKYEKYKARVELEGKKCESTSKAVAKSASLGRRFFELSFVTYPYLHKSGSVILPRVDTKDMRSDFCDVDELQYTSWVID